MRRGPHGVGAPLELAREQPPGPPEGRRGVRVQRRPTLWRVEGGNSTEGGGGAGLEEVGLGFAGEPKFGLETWVMGYG